MGTRQPSGGVMAGLVALAAAAMMLAGCASDDTADGAAAGETSPAPSSPTASASPSRGGGTPRATTPTTPGATQGTVLGITIRGDSVEPRGERVPVAVAEPFTVVIDSDTAGELHVHATPEAQFAFSPGRSREQLTIDRPGVVEVELHEPTEVTVFQLEVR